VAQDLILSKSDEITPESMPFSDQNISFRKSSSKLYFYNFFKFLDFVMTSQSNHGNYCLMSMIFLLLLC